MTGSSESGCCLTCAGSLVLGGTCILWLASQRLGIRGGQGLEQEEEKVAQYCGKTCTLDSYEASSITESELAKLLASPKYLAWLSTNAQRVKEAEAQSNRLGFWRACCAFVVFLIGVFGLPFASFDLSSTPITFSNILRDVEPLYARFFAAVSLMGLVWSFFAPGNKNNNNLIALVAFVAMLFFSNAILFGAGYLALIVAVALRVFWV